MCRTELNLEVWDKLHFLGKYCNLHFFCGESRVRLKPKRRYKAISGAPKKSSVRVASGRGRKPLSG